MFPKRSRAKAPDVKPIPRTILGYAEDQSLWIIVRRTDPPKKRTS
ncbi:MAG TPA: hypothetical protein VJ397_04870 [Thermoplasmata archaeon]|nr:hypothetical protein [Thermoplasmata archaeon]